MEHPREKHKPSEILIKENIVNNMNHQQYFSSNKYIISNQENPTDFFAKFNDIENLYPEIPLCAFNFISNTSNKNYQFLI